MKYNVTDIEFDFDDGNDGESYPLTFEEEIAIRDSALGVWEADNEDDMIDEITAATGYLINNIYFDIQLEDYSLGNQDDTFIDINNTGGKY
tara:strand:+ start:180 stop:452 length:273 start_codon:yes stop_codon:yes gene_type:complete